MAHEMVILVDATTGTLLIEGPDRLPQQICDRLAGRLGRTRTIGCAAPVDVRVPVPASAAELASPGCIRVAGCWHGSLPCPNDIEKREHLPRFQEQHGHVLERRILGTEMLPADRDDEIADAVGAPDGRIVAMGGTLGQVPAATARDEPAMGGD